MINRGNDRWVRSGNLQNRITPEALLVTFTAVFGSLLLFAIPPFQIPDEHQHFGRSYSVSEGYLFHTSVDLPAGFQRLMDLTKGIAFHPDKKIHLNELMTYWNHPMLLGQRINIELPSSSVFTPVPYLFSAAGLFVGRLVDGSPLITFYVGRLLNLAIWTLLSYAAVRITPVCKWLFVLLLLAPMSLSQAGSYSADSLTNAVCFLWIGLCLMLARSDEKPLSLGRIVLLFGVGWLLPLLKPPYTFLAALVFLIPGNKFGSRQKYFTAIAVLLVGAGVLFVVSSNINRDYYFSKSPYPGIDRDAQIALVIENPVAYLKTLIDTLFYYRLVFLTISYIGILGWLDTSLPGYVYWTYPLMIMIVALTETYRVFHLSLRHRILLVSTGLITTVVVATGQYVTWTPVGSPVIWGIQGRYFVPIIPVLLVALHNKQCGCQRWILSYVVPVYLVTVLGLTLFVVINRFYYM